LYHHLQACAGVVLGEGAVDRGASAAHYVIHFSLYASKRYGDQIVAIKVLNHCSTPEDKATLEACFFREVNMMCKVKHGHLAKVLPAQNDILVVIRILRGLSAFYGFVMQYLPQDMYLHIKRPILASPLVLCYGSTLRCLACNLFSVLLCFLYILCYSCSFAFYAALSSLCFQDVFLFHMLIYGLTFIKCVNTIWV
jgi:hypothetical protein